MFSKMVTPCSPEMDAERLPEPNLPGRKTIPDKQSGLSVKFIRKVVEMLNKQFPDIPIWIHGSEAERFKQTNKQIKHAHVHIHEGHATLSACLEGNLVHYIDSEAREGIERTYNIIDIEQQLYNAYPYRFELRFLDVQQQKPGSADCGVFVIAFLVQILHDKKIDGLKEIRFKYDEMRPHLLKCCENNEFIPFPQEKI